MVGPVFVFDEVKELPGVAEDRAASAEGGAEDDSAGGDGEGVVFIDRVGVIDGGGRCEKGDGDGKKSCQQSEGESRGGGNAGRAGTGGVKGVGCHGRSVGKKA